MRTIDVNRSAGLALVQDDDGLNARYVPLEDAPPEVDGGLFAYLDQLHYVCRAHVQGLFVTRVDPLIPGWQEHERLLALTGRARS